MTGHKNVWGTDTATVQQVHSYHKEKVESLISQALTELHAVPPEVQFDVMNHQIKALQALQHVLNKQRVQSS
jgi:actin-like ATPase involved in cell morphogenesis